MTHDQAVQKLRAKLFSIHKPDEYGIVDGSETVVTPITYNGETSLGGLRFELKAGKFDRVKLTVRHQMMDSFSVSLQDIEGSYTLRAIDAPFKELDRAVLKLLRGL